MDSKKELQAVGQKAVQTILLLSAVRTTCPTKSLVASPGSWKEEIIHLWGCYKYIYFLDAICYYGLSLRCLPYYGHTVPFGDAPMNSIGRWLEPPKQNIICKFVWDLQMFIGKQILNHRFHFGMFPKLRLSHSRKNCWC